MSVLKLWCVGHLGKDAVVNQVNGKSVINFTVAHTESYKKADGTKVETTVWLSCAYWTDSTAVAPYLLKGALVAIEGLPQPALYDKQDGSKGLDFKVRVFNLNLLARPKDQAAAAPAAGGAYVAPKAADITEPIDDLPF